MKDTFDEIKEVLTDYISNRFEYKRPDVHFGFGKNLLCVDRKKIDLYLRFLDMPLRKKPTIVIARMFFHERRAGHGTDFLKLMVDIAVTYNYQYIELESCDDNAKGFAKHFGFNFFDSTEKNCRTTVSELICQFGKEAAVV